MESRVAYRSRILGKLIGIGVLCVLFAARSAEAVTIAWDPNPEADLAGYRLYLGATPGTYTKTIDVGHVITFTLPDVSDGGISYFAVSAYDIFGNESSLSKEVSITNPTAPTAGHSVSVSTTAAWPGTNVTVTVEGAQNDLDWVGVYSSSSPAEDGRWVGCLDYKYIYGRTTLTFRLPTFNGTFHYRFYENNGTRLLAVSPDIVVQGF